MRRPAFSARALWIVASVGWVALLVGWVLLGAGVRLR